MGYIFKKSKIIKNALKFKYRPSRNIVFWLKDTDMVSVVQLILSTLEKYGRAALPDNIEIIKNTPVNKRLLFRIKPSVPGQESFIVKVCNVHLLRLRLKYCWMRYFRYGFAEAANLVIASDRGIKVPRPYGFGCINSPFCLIEKDIVILEDLNHHISVAKLLQQNRKDEQECINILDRVIPILISHYKAGCNNWDFKPDSIMFEQQRLASEPVVLDFEHVVFHNKPNLEILIFLAARIAWHVMYAADWMNREIIDSWVAELLDRVKVEDLGIRKRFLERFNHYVNILPYMPHRDKERLV